ncbi:unnamed protein product [Rhodiola kirilowii]
MATFVFLILLLEKLLSRRSRLFVQIWLRRNTHSFCSNLNLSLIFWEAVRKILGGFPVSGLSEL